MLELRLSEHQKAIRKELAKQIAVQPGSSLSSLIGFIRFGVGMVNHRQEETKAKIHENNDTLSKRLADEANIILQQEQRAFANDMQTVLTARKQEVLSAKRDAVNQYIKMMPSDNLGKKLHYICDFGHLFDKSIWAIFIDDPEIASNYIASKIVQTKAEEQGIDYVIGFNPARIMEELDNIEAMIANSIPHIGEEEPNLTLMSLISENPNSPIQRLITDLDTDIATIIPAEKISAYKRLTNAQKKAYDDNNIALSVQIERFIDKNKTVLASPEEITDSLMEQAENLIAQSEEQ